MQTVTASSAEMYLASGSPRRSELLSQIGVTFDVLKVQVEEQRQNDEDAIAYVQRLAQAKAEAGVLVASEAIPILGADTVGVLDGQVLEKPKNEDDAVEMLMAMSGRTHSVITGVALARSDRCSSFYCETKVRFVRFTEVQARRYWHTGEPVDKAGAYGIQGKGAVFVTHLEGSYSNVVGLPLAETAVLLQEFGVAIWQKADN